MRQVDFRTTFGRLGSHPGHIGPQAGDVIFRRAMSYKEGAVFVEVGSGTGRGTVLLGTAAKNIGAKVYAIEDWDNVPNDVGVLYRRAIETHGLAEVVTRVKSWPTMDTDLVVVNSLSDGDEGQTKTLMDNLKDKTVIIFTIPGEERTITGFKMLEQMPKVFTVYEKEATVPNIPRQTFGDEKEEDAEITTAEIKGEDDAAA